MNRPKVKLVGEEGDAFSILARCSRAARQAGWSEEELNEFRDAATTGDYDHLLRMVMEHFDVDTE